MNQGWQCPVCQRVWSPIVTECKECAKAIGALKAEDDLRAKEEAVKRHEGVDRIRRALEGKGLPPPCNRCGGRHPAYGRCPAAEALIGGGETGDTKAWFDAQLTRCVTCARCVTCGGEHSYGAPHFTVGGPSAAAPTPLPVSDEAKNVQPIGCRCGHGKCPTHGPFPDPATLRP